MSYLAVDGDDVGSQIEYYLFLHRLDQLSQFSDRLASAIDWLAGQAIDRLHARVLLRGGDNLLFELPADGHPRELLEQLRAEFFQQCCVQLSMGLGASPLEAYLALKFAKASGKDCIKEYTDINPGGMGR